MSQIEPALKRLYNKHRIVFWYDDKRELQAEYDALALPDVEKIVLDGNQFAVKHRILREERKQKFLLYHSGPAPAHLDNWLLDVQLAHVVFSADQIALWLSELGLGLVEFGDVARQHKAFFESGRQRKKLSALLPLTSRTPQDEFRLKMLAVIAGADPQLDAILEELLDELAQEQETAVQLIARCGLTDFLWQQVARSFGYRTATPGVRDFAIALFAGGYALSLGERLPAGPTASQWTSDALVFLKRWKNTINQRSKLENRPHAFDVLSEQSVTILNIKGDLQQRAVQALVDLDLFELIDQRIINELVGAVTERTISAEQCAAIVRQRRVTHWYDKYQHIYEAILAAARFMAALDGVTLTVQSAAQAFEQYRSRWYALDQLYRHCIYHAQQANQPTLLAPLLNSVEKLYSNQYLLPLNDAWQVVVDGIDEWARLPVPTQRNFFETHVRPFLRDGNKVHVIISDALRYEIGEELQQRVRREDRYEAELEATLTLLPSYTQLGMAALLPQSTLVLNNDGSVLADAQKTQGTANRAKILATALNGRGTAVRSADLLNMSRDESRALLREHDVVYVYQNRIDATGDKRDSEGRVFAAVEETLDELITLIKKLANANASNILVTADHGFIYQNQPLDESDFLGDTVVGDDVLLHNRRFVLGQGLHETAGFRKFSPVQIGMHGAVDILIPKSINRLRVKGAGSRYVHGGAALQEVIVPVLRINKKRRSDIAQVAVDILQGPTTTITTGQLTVAFYQKEPATAKLQPRTLRAGIYTQSGDLISDQHTLTFDYASDNPRDRERRVRFVLTSEADAANGQDVLLQLDERVGETSHYKPYRSARYLLRRSFTSDFDF